MCEISSTNNKLNTSETLDLIELSQQGDVFALEKLYNSNINLVKAVARRYMPSLNARFDFDDLVQEAYIGFVKAVKSYKPLLNVKFSTVAVECMNNSIKNFLKHNCSHLKITSTFLNRLNCLKKSYSDLLKENNVKPTIEQVSKRSGLSVNEILEINIALECNYSLDVYRNFEHELDDRGLYKIIANNETSIDETVENKDLHENIMNILLKALLPDFDCYSKEELYLVFEFGRLKGINKKFPSEELVNNINVIERRLLDINNIDNEEEKEILYSKYRKLYKRLRQMFVILKRYYNPYGKVPSQDEVSEYFGISKQMISSIEVETLKILKKKLIKSNIDLSPYCKNIKR